jgi:NADH-quinone oxidoreductase subunit L
LFAVGVFVAALTTFYTFRLFFVVFFGKEKSEHASHAHESPAIITLPLIALAILSVVGGVIGIKEIYHAAFVSGGGESTNFAAALYEPFIESPLAASLGLLAVAIGFFTAFVLYKNAETDPLPAKLGGLSTAMKNRFYFDEIYEATFIRAHDFIAAVCGVIDRWLLEGFVIGAIRGTTDLAGRGLRLVQTGNLQTYAFLFVLGVALVLYFVLGK